MINYLLIILQVIILDGILSIDNAAALGAIASKLPIYQQKLALKAGILGAYAGRGLMILFASWIVNHEWTSLLAAGYLLYLSIGHFLNWPMLTFKSGKGTGNLVSTIIVIELTDLGFSIDNVAAIAALTQQVWLIIIGVCISILIMRFAAGIFIKLIVFEPLLEHAAFILIFAIAVELLLKFIRIPISELGQFSISVGIIIMTILIGRLKKQIYEHV